MRRRRDRSPYRRSRVAVFDAAEHHVGEGVVDAHANGVAVEGFLFAGAWDFSEATGIGPAGGTVDQCAVEGVADAAADGALPVETVVNRGDAAEVCRVIRPVLFEVRFKASTQLLPSSWL